MDNPIEGPSIFSPLEEGEIRILSLNSGDEADELSGTLSKQQISDAALSYEALSYAWGDEMSGSGMSLHQSTEANTTASYILLRQNLESALRHLRPADGHPPRRLWIDMLCINQSNDPEKSLQVRRMADIFAGAQRTLIWLGPASECSPGAMRLVREISSRFRKKEEHATDTQWLRNRYEDRGPGLFTLMQRIWWKRLWVVQEALKGRDPVVLCGPDHVPLQSFAYLDHVKDVVNRDGGFFLTTTSFPLLLSSGWSDLILRPASESSLFYLINITNGLDCRHKRDRLFSLLPLSTVGDQAAVPIDYDETRLPDWLLLVRATVHVLHHTDSYWPLTASWKRASSPAPSWTRDWFSGQTELYSYYSDSLGRFSSCGDFLEETKVIRHVPQIEKFPSRLSLIANGWIVDVVSFVDPWMERGNRRPVTLNDLLVGKNEDKTLWSMALLRYRLSNWWNIASQWPWLRKYPTSANRADPTPSESDDNIPWLLFLQTLTANQLSIDTRQPEQIASGHWKSIVDSVPHDESGLKDQQKEDQICLLEWLIAGVSGDVSLANDQPDHPIVRHYRALRDNKARVKTWELRIFYFCYLRSLMITANGYLGLAPAFGAAAAKEGDIVCILKNCRTPVILHPVGIGEPYYEMRDGPNDVPELVQKQRTASDGQMFSWVGDAYVHGIMHGEWFAEREGLEEPVSFEIV